MRCLCAKSIYTVLIRPTSWQSYEMTLGLNLFAFLLLHACTGQSADLLPLIVLGRVQSLGSAQKLLVSDCFCTPLSTLPALLQRMMDAQMQVACKVHAAYRAVKLSSAQLHLLSHFQMLHYLKQMDI